MVKSRTPSRFECEKGSLYSLPALCAPDRAKLNPDVQVSLNIHLASHRVAAGASVGARAGDLGSGQLGLMKPMTSSRILKCPGSGASACDALP